MSKFKRVDFLQTYKKLNIENNYPNSDSDKN